MKKITKKTTKKVSKKATKKQTKKVKLAAPKAIKKVIGLILKTPAPRQTDGFEYYFDEDIKTFMFVKEYESFCKWMNGQTVGVIGSKSAIYACDVQRFLDSVRKNIPTYFD